jgi:hypothetical protein
MSAQNVIPAKILAEGVGIQSKINQSSNDHANAIALGIILMVLAVLIMFGVLIFLSMSGSAESSLLFIGIAPFILMFMVLILSR